MVEHVLSVYQAQGQSPVLQIAAAAEAAVVVNK